MKEVYGPGISQRYKVESAASLVSILKHLKYVQQRQNRNYSGCFINLCRMQIIHLNIRVPSSGRVLKSVSALY
jgi:hypothetical protein